MYTPTSPEAVLVTVSASELGSDEDTGEESATTAMDALPVTPHALTEEPGVTFWNARFCRTVNGASDHASIPNAQAGLRSA